MKNLVIYDSKFGNTRKLAEAMADAIAGSVTDVKDVNPSVLKDVTLLLLGGPVHAWRPSKAMSDFLESLDDNSLAGVPAAAFDTRVKVWYSGNAARKISRALAGKGARIVAEPRGFYVYDNEGPLLDGEIKQAREWAGRMYNKAVALGGS